MNSRICLVVALAAQLLLPFLSFLAGKGYDPSGNHSDYSAFNDWLQCYYNPEMRNVVDHDGRTMWFKVNIIEGPGGKRA